jgi:hypothetical protein
MDEPAQKPFVHPAIIPVYLGPSDQLTDMIFFTPKLQRGKEPDTIIIGDAKVNESRWGAFARIELDVGDWIESYDSHKTASVAHLTDLPYNHDYTMCLTRTKSSNLVIDAFHVDSCHARFMDEATTEEDENCMFQEQNKTIWI